MRLLFVIVVILGALALNGLAAESEPTNLDKVRAVFNFLIEDSFEKYDKEAFKNWLIHFSKGKLNFVSSSSRLYIGHAYQIEKFFAHESQSR